MNSSVLKRSNGDVADKLESALASRPGKIVFICAITLLLLFQSFFENNVVPYSDAVRYVTFSLNFLFHGTFSSAAFSASVSPEPTQVMGGPLIGFELSLAALIDPGTLETFVCAAKHDGSQTACKASIFGLKILNFLETGIALIFIWKIGFYVFNRTLGADLCVLFAMVNAETTAYNGLALTEPVYFALISGFTYYLLRISQPNSSFAQAALGGAFLGLTILAKPVAQMLLVLVPAFLVATALIRGNQLRHAARQSSVVVFVSAVFILPWLLRSYGISGDFSLSSRSYLEAALSHRVAFNLMSWTEWLVGWIYYLPDFGDSLAATLFPAPYYERLGWSDVGYYVYGRDVLHKELLIQLNGQSVISHLISEHVFGDLVKHGAVSALLLWRGATVGGYPGLIALLCLPFLMIYSTPQRRWLLICIGFPAVMIAGLNAGLSVSITRYNLALIPLYAVVLACLANAIIQMVSKPGRNVTS